VGGLMMLVRSEVWQIPVTIVEPSANPLLSDVPGTIISLTPYQLHHILKNDSSTERLLQFREVLIGGASINSELELAIQELGYTTIFRHSYGMSETYSHVALRTINGTEASDYYTPLPDVRVEHGLDNCAVIYTPYYPAGLQTNDIIESDINGRFKIIGRADFIINTGGVKISTELLEKLISENLKTDNPFIISSVKDTVLGEKIVLVCTNQEKFKFTDWAFLETYSAYAKPKEIIQIRDIPINKSGKIDRLKVKEMISSD
jgi:O-succinylbenzoic acid--CoA ligase